MLGSLFEFAQRQFQVAPRLQAAFSMENRRVAIPAVSDPARSRKAVELEIVLHLDGWRPNAGSETCQFRDIGCSLPIVAMGVFERPVRKPNCPIHTIAPLLRDGSPPPSVQVLAFYPLSRQNGPVTLGGLHGRSYTGLGHQGAGDTGGFRESHPDIKTGANVDSDNVRRGSSAECGDVSNCSCNDHRRRPVSLCCSSASTRSESRTAAGGITPQLTGSRSVTAGRSSKLRRRANVDTWPASRYHSTAADCFVESAITYFFLANCASLSE